MSIDCITLTLAKVAEMLELFPHEGGSAQIQMTVNADNVECFPEFTQRDLDILKRVIYTGCVKSELLRPGKGFKTLSMAVMLKNMVEAANAERLERMDEEILQSLVAYWRRKIEENKGDVSKVRQAARNTWGDKESMPHDLKAKLNKAYKIATNGTQPKTA